MKEDVNVRQVNILITKPSPAHAAHSHKPRHTFAIQRF
jgi:hypothetical protein